MPIELKMPALSPTMEKGSLARWLVAVGDAVKPGDMLAEIETDKATMEIEAIDEGRITRIFVDAGTSDVPVGTVIALLAEGNEDAPVARAPAPTPTATAPAPLAAPVVTAARPAPASPATTIDRSTNATPLARRIAAAAGMALTDIRGSGPNGRIVRADLSVSRPARPVSQPLPSAAPVPAPVPAIIPPPAGVPVETIPLSSMRRTIARRLTEAKQSVPHFYLTARCNLDPLLALRADLNASLAGGKISVNDLLMKAMALALVEVPEANVQYGGEVLHRFDRVDIAMAVAIEGGLVTPIIRDAGSLSLSAIARTTKALAAKAREGRLTPEDYQGGTASLSNLGMFGIDEMVPVINPPQALILGVAAGIEQPWKVDGAIALATIMAATGSFDHRAIDGAIAARFMASFRDHVETPLRIVT